MTQLFKKLGVALCTVAVLVTASPMPAPTASPDIKNAVALNNRATTCTFKDAAAVSKSKKSCATIVLDNIAVPSGVTLNLEKLNKGTHVIFQGTTTWGYEEWSGPLVSVSGEDIVVGGIRGHKLDGGGARWWDGKGGNGGKTKPKFFYARKLTGKSSINGLKIVNSPVHTFSINGSKGLTLAGITIDSSAGDKLGGHNTDAFNVGASSDITIIGATVYNQDDCLAVNSGKRITFTRGYCSGGHGLSIGSVGGRSDNTVSGVEISLATITNSDNGIRIKTISGATGVVDRISYKDLVLSDIVKKGIVVQQDYKNGSPTGIPTTGVPITNLSISNVNGTVKSGGENIYILCGKGSCSGWNWSGVSVKGGKKSTKCQNIPAGAFC